MVRRRDDPASIADRVRRALADHREPILATWECEVRALPITRSLTGPILRDHLASLLDGIAGAASELAAASPGPWSASSASSAT